jgi:hypothetical protein
VRLDPQAADKLVKICRLFGSDQTGERASAALMAHKLLQAVGLDWADVISVQAGDAGVVFALRNKHLLNTWQRQFVTGLSRWRGPLTHKQRTKLDEIVAELSRAA